MAMFWATCTDGSSWSWIGENLGGGRSVQHSNRVRPFFGNKRRRRVRRRVFVITIREIQWRIIIKWQGLARRYDVRGLCLAFAGLVIVVVVNQLVDGLLKK
jgi:hypothetical protein